MDDKSLASSDPVAQGEKPSTELHSSPQSGGPQYPPTRTVALIVTALYLAVFLIALVSCPEASRPQSD